MPVWLPIVLSAVVACAVFVIGVGFERMRLRRRRTRRFAKAAAAEVAAERLLGRLGYTVLARQAAGGWQIEVDGTQTKVSLRADLVVARRGKTFVAEVKTGQVAPDVGHAATRRQLMEYAVAYDVDGVLLVDMESERVRSVAFPELSRPPARGALRWATLFALLVLGVGIGVAAQPQLVSWWLLATN